MKQSKRDLITAAFHNQETGRMALGFWHHFLKDETGAMHSFIQSLRMKSFRDRKISIRRSPRI